MEQCLSDLQIRSPSSYRCDCENLKRECCLIGGDTDDRVCIRFPKRISHKDVEKMLKTLLKSVWNESGYTFQWCPHQGMALGNLYMKPNDIKYTYVGVYLNGLKMDGDEVDKWKPLIRAGVEEYFGAEPVENTTQAFFRACRFGDVEIAQKCLSKSTPDYIQDLHEGLRIACTHQQLEIINLIASVQDERKISFGTCLEYLHQYGLNSVRPVSNRELLKHLLKLV